MANKTPTPSLTSKKFTSGGITPTITATPTGQQPRKAVSTSKTCSTLTPDCYKQVQLQSTPMRTPPTKSLGEIRPLAGSEPSSKPDLDLLLSDKETEENSSIVVAVRVRPLGTRELEDTKVRSVVRIEGNSVHVDQASGVALHFTYDQCLWSSDREHPQYADQQRVYEVVAQPLLDKAFEGYNTCLFAYGQTGSGKSYSIMGHQHETGIIPRFSQDLFERIQSSKKRNERICIEISYFEMYNEKIHDLLASSEERIKKAPMRVREHPVVGPYVVDLSTFVVTCYDDLAGWLSLGNKQRATAATVMNEKSSRSHSVFTIVVTRVQTEMIDGEAHEHSRRSKVNIVDLAGSERIDVSQTTGLRLKEGASINKSLLTLGKVICQLSEMSLSNGNGRKKVFVPYRESVLTWLLKESLGGNSRTTMLATVSPSSAYVEETLSTLRYARQARTIVNVVRINEDPKARLIRELRAEIEKLRGQQHLELPIHLDGNRNEIDELRDKLKEKEQLLKQTTRSFQEKLDQAIQSKALESENLQKAGIAFTVNNQLPNLVNLNEDPQLSEALVYVLREGDVTVGRMRANSKQDIQLKGSLIADNHCTISNVDGVITLVPNGKAQTYINGHLLTESKSLHHGDRIILGGEHYFRLNNVAEVSKESRRTSTQKDFTFARDELLRVQELRMKEELEKTRQRTRQEMIDEIEAIQREAELELSMQRHGFEDRIRELTEALEEKHLQSEKATLELELQKNLMDLEVKTMKRRSAAAENIDVFDLSPLRTNFLDEIVEHLNAADISVFCGGANSIASPGLGLYEISLMINEANSICRDLRNNIAFKQHDQFSDKEYEIAVKVVDNNRDLTTTISTEKFKGKLERLRRIADGETELRLFEANEVWSKDDHLPMLLSPKMKELIRKVQQQQHRNEWESPNEPRVIAASATKNTVLRSASTDGRLANDSAPNSFAICKDHCLNAIECFSEFACSSKFRMDTSNLLSDLSAIITCNTELIESAEGSLELASRLSSLLSTVLLRAARLLPPAFSQRSKRLDELGVELGTVLDRLGGSIVALITSLASDRQPDMRDAARDVGSHVLECSELVGQLTAGLGVRLDDDRSPAPSEVHCETGLRFLRGVEAVSQRILATAISKLDDIDLRVNMLCDDSFFDTANEIEGTLFQCSKKVIAEVKQWISMYNKRQVETATMRADCISRLSLVANRSQEIVVNTSLLVEALASLWDDVEIYTRGGRINLRETLDFVAEIGGAIDALFSLSRVQFASGTELQANDFNRAARHITSSSQSLKVVIRQALERDRLSSQSSRGGKSPSVSSAQPPNGSDSNGSARQSPCKTKHKTVKAPKQSTPVNVSPSFAVPRRPTPSHLISLSDEFRSIPLALNDDTSIWDSSLQSSRSYTLPTGFHCDAKEKQNAKSTAQ